MNEDAFRVTIAGDAINEVWAFVNDTFVIIVDYLMCTNILNGAVGQGLLPENEEAVSISVTCSLEQTWTFSNFLIISIARLFMRTPILTRFLLILQRLLPKQVLTIAITQARCLIMCRALLNNCLVQIIEGVKMCANIDWRRKREWFLVEAP